MPNYRSLVVGGFFNNPDTNPTGKASIRYNNIGAVNGALKDGTPIKWVQDFPGFVKVNVIGGGNPIAIFETPEQGVALWWTLMQKYIAGGHDTVQKIIDHYGGGQDYAAYAAQVEKWGGANLTADTKINLADDKQILQFLKLMGRYEAGEPTPLHDDQIIYGFNYARQLAGQPVSTTQPSAQPTPPAGKSGIWWSLLTWLSTLLAPKDNRVKAARILKRGVTGDDVKAVQTRLHALGFEDVIPDGDFGEVTEAAVRNFQTARNINPDGEVGDLTLAELNKTAVGLEKKPPASPPSEVKYGPKPPWYVLAEADIGFHEIGANLGIEKFIDTAKSGTRAQLLGQPWCAVGLNSDFERSGVTGSRSAMARSFENSPNFVKLAQPCLGCVVTFWRGSISAGTGHCCFYDGERKSDGAIRGIGYNEDDKVQRSFHSKARFVGYFYPKGVPLPKLGPIIVNDLGNTAGSET
jgi:uncharacterized protein (TIGR02594 family)